MKLKLYKRAVAVLCGLALVCGTLAGCGGKNQNEKVDNTVEDKTNLKVMIYAKGYGTDWLTAMAEAFEKKYEGVNVDVSIVKSADVMNAELENSEYCDTDLFFGISSTAHALPANFAKSYNNGQALRDLTYLYDSEIEGEGITLGEKMNSTIKQASLAEGRDTEDTSDDKYYFVSYVTGAMGLYCNETVIDEALGKGNWKMPNTSQELVELCKRLKEKDCHILLPGMIDTWAYSMYLSWWSQYEGYENYMKFFDGIGYDKSKNREVANSHLIFQQEGRRQSAIASQDLLSYKNGYTLQESAEINTNTLNEYQTRFTLSEYKYAFYPCGDWLMQELKNNSTIESDSTITFMKTPVISTIIDSTNGYSSEHEARLPNVTSDEMLSQVVDYVDGKGELPAGVTEAEVEYVRQARNTVACKALEHIAYAPVFSNAKTLADNFLLFMASDEGIKIFKENCIGGFAPYEYDYSDMDLTHTEETVALATKAANYVGNFTYNQLFYRAGVKALTMSSTTLDGEFCMPNGKSGEEINQAFIDTYSAERWNNYLSKLSY